MSMARQRFSNPGPRWGYHAIAFFDRILPACIVRACVAAGALLGMLVMGEQRRHSRDYLQAVMGREPTAREQFRHFHQFAQALVRKLTLSHRSPPQFTFAEGANKAGFEDLCQSGRPALFGTFHVGTSDLMGCLLSDFGRSVSLVRLRVGNSLDTEILEKMFRGSVRFIWINDGDGFVFGIRDAVERGESIGLQCDRIDQGGRQAPFRFLGKERMFPTTIYHLAGLFRMPVAFAFSVTPEPEFPIEVHTSRVFEPVGDRDRDLALGMQHFQEVLDDLESHLRREPCLWFNFRPLNPPVHG